MAIRMTVARRLGALSAMAGLALLGLGGLAYMDSSKLSNHANEIQQITQAVRLQMTADMAHDAIRSVQLNALLAAHNKDLPAVQAAATELRAQQGKIEDSLAQLAKIPLPVDVTQALQAVEPKLKAYVRSANEVVTAAAEDLQAAEAVRPAFVTAFSALEVEMGRVSDLIEGHATRIRDESETLRAQTLLWILVCTAGMSGLLVCVGLWTSRVITRRLGAEPEDLARVAQTIAAGDLSRPVPIQGAHPASVLVAMSHMQAALQQIVSSVRQSAECIATGSREIATGNTDLSQRTEHQASNLQETAATMEELHATVKNGSDTAITATQLAAQASGTAVQGGEAVRQVVQVMGEINASSKRIGDIITVIDGIAFQTNILALNAAVEAARAGEQGRGFAVVAGEVRGLARRCTEAAKEIKGLIEVSVGKVDAGSRLVGHAGDTIEQVVQQVKRVNDLIGEISSAVQEQTTGIGGVNRALSELDQVTQQNAALVEQSAAAAASLTQQAERMVGAVAVFQLPAGSKAAAGSPASAPSGSGSAPATGARPAPRPTPMATAAVSTRPSARPRSGTLPATAAPAPAAAATGVSDDWETF